ncbi:hypothetical protein [Rhodococcus erythropolis]|nr:hypothetical protein [Rhodococcus erythropolis]
MPNFVAMRAGARPEGWMLYGNRLWVQSPRKVMVHPTPDDSIPLGFIADMTTNVVHGRLVCVSIRVTSEQDGEVTSDGLRRIPIANWVEQAARKLGIVRELEQQPDGTFTPVEFRMPDPHFADDGMTDEALESISRIYAFCMATGQKPTGVLERQFGMPRPTASRWISIARKRGILSDAHEFVRDAEDLISRDKFIRYSVPLEEFNRGR